MAGARQPNILFLMADEHRFDWHGVDGKLPVRTPHLLEMARHGAWFEHAVTPSPLCAPARTCLALGTEYGRGGAVRVNRADLPEEARKRTFYRRLRELGYRVANCGKLDLNKKSHSWGLDGQHFIDGRSVFREWGFSDGFDSEGKGPACRFAKKPRGPYGAYLKQKGLADLFHDDLEPRREAESPYLLTHPTPIPAEAYADNWVGRSGLELLERLQGGGPWFLQVNFSGPHPPMDVTAEMHRWYQNVLFPQPDGSTEFTAEIHQQIRRNYSAMVENIDRWIGRYLERLRLLGLREDTLVVYTSDHGEMLGDRELWKKRQPYQPSSGVPLAMIGPGVRPGLRVSGPATVLDLAATFLEFAGGGSETFNESRSMRRLLSGDLAAGRPFVRSACGDWRMACDGRHKLVEGHAGAGLSGRSEALPWLVDLQNDPLERVDLAATHAEIVARMTEWLNRIPRSGSTPA
ncbi:MAG: sulfatase-like hydrolase/transferase [Planctomycetota bacterium]